MVAPLRELHSSLIVFPYQIHPHSTHGLEKTAFRTMVMQYHLLKNQRKKQMVGIRRVNDTESFLRKKYHFVARVFRWLALIVQTII